MARLGNKLSRAGSSKHTTPTKSKPKHWHLQTGTPNALTEPIRFDSHTKLKNAALKIIADWEPWCLRHNHVGSEALYAAKDFVNVHYAELPDGGEHVDATFCFDEHTGTSIRIVMWRTT